MMIHQRKRILIAVAVTAVVALGGVAAAVVAGGGTETTATAGAATNAASTGARAAGLSATGCGTYSGRGCSPTSKRVDTATPSFSSSTEITNPLFPISRLQSVVLLGHVDGKPFRSETTLLPGTAGRDGPAALIMPGAPKVGDVFRPENVTGVVFEEVVVKSVGTTVKGPRGSVSGALVAEELHLDRSHSDKIFAPGYGEFQTGSDGDLEALALAVPTDALAGPTPPALRFLTTSAWGILENARLQDWEAASTTVKRMHAAWRTVETGAPPRIAAPLNNDLNALTRKIKDRRTAKVAQLAIDVAQSALDLELRHRPAVEVDVERFHLWTQQLRVHAAARDLAAVTGDVAVLEWIRDRVTGALDPAALQGLDAGLRGLRAATDAKNLPAAADHAARLGAQLRRSAGA